MAGLSDVTIHDLRHTCASRLIQNGMSLYEVVVADVDHSRCSTGIAERAGESAYRSPGISLNSSKFLIISNIRHDYELLTNHHEVPFTC